MTDLLESALHGRVLRLALNRPDKRNALNAELCRAIVASVEDADRDPRVGAILLTGNGKSFCAGMDLKEIELGNAEEINRAHEQLFTVGSRLGKPIVAAIHGAAIAGGTGLVANCHIAVASQDAAFGLTEIRLGLWPFLIYRAVTAAIGERRTLELALTGRIFGAAEAREAGLIHDVADEPEQRAAYIAESLAAFSPTAIRSGLGFVQQVRGRSWEEAGEIARAMRSEVFASPDFEEGIRAFREKRSPSWPSLS